MERKTHINTETILHEQNINISACVTVHIMTFIHKATGVHHCHIAPGSI